MPKINRIRIANVPYGSKYILDQIFDSYSGENILINLSNGGGKSVLTQLMMQPIIPTQKVHNRSMESYLTSKEPTFVMIEWVLENSARPTYFLTGIVMNKAVSEDNRARIKYFTFTNEYQSANLYDIKNIDFISSENGNMVYKSYEYCLKSLKQQSIRNPKIAVFSVDDKKEYNELLEQHGIFKDEWKVLAKINEKEGGIDDLFEQCKTSDDVINNWILKNISSNLDNGENLREMFGNLIEEIVEKESTIKRKEILDDFSKVATDYLLKLEDICNKIDEENKIVKGLEDNYLKLENYRVYKEKERANLENRQSSISQELIDIDYESISEDYHKLKFDLEKKIDKVNELSNLMEQKKLKKEETDKNINLLRASKLYSEFKECETRLLEFSTQLENIRNTVSDDERKNIEYSLKVQYEKLLKESNLEFNNLELALNTAKERLDKLKADEKNNHEELIQNELNLGKLNANIEAFKKEETRVFSELNINLIRNLLGEFDEKDVLNIKDRYKQRQDEAFKEIDRLGLDIEAKTKDIAEKNTLIEKVDEEVQYLAGELKNAQINLENYNNAESDMIKALESIAFDKERLFEQETNLVEIERQIENTHKRNVDNILLVEKKKDLQQKLKQGEIHVDNEFGRILESSKINYETGENYLKSQPKEYVNKLLSLNPLLPYCYILYNQEDYDKVLDLNVENESTKVIPVMLFSDIEKNYNAQNRMIDFDNNLMLTCFYHKYVFDAKEKEKFEAELDNEIVFLENKINDDKLKIRNLEKVKSKVQAFSYKKEDKKNLAEKVNGFMEAIDNERNKKIILGEEISKLQSEINNANLDIINKKDLVKEYQREETEFSSLLEKDKVYCEDVKDKNNLEKRKVELNKAQDVISLEINEIEKANSDRQVEKINIKNRIDKINEKYAIVKFIEEGVIIEKALEELEVMYQVIRDKIDKDEKRILEDIKSENKHKEAKEKELKKRYSIYEGMYENLEYSEEKEDSFIEESETIEKELKFSIEEYSNEDKAKIRLETRLEALASDIKRLGKDEPLEPKDIKGNYKERTKNLKMEFSNNDSLIKGISAEIKRIEVERNKIERTIAPPDFKEVEVNSFNFEELNLNEVLKIYADKKSQNENDTKLLERLYNDIVTENQGKDIAIDSMLKNMNPICDMNQYEKYYFIYERINTSLKYMQSILDVLVSTIEHIEKQKAEIKQHAFLQGKNIYMEMKKISDGSMIKMPGKSRKVQLMEIDLPKELDQFATDRVDSYIESCISKLREECNLQEKKGEIVRKRVREWLSDRELLNKVIDLESIDVKLYKIDITEAGSGLKRWKDVIVDNSGGEKFVSCLILVLSMMQYSRRKILEKYGEDESIESSKILIIDNPFGKMSSTHLLNGLMLILDKFNAQVICLSAISESSVTNQFKLIYQMSLKSSMYSNNAYLTMDKLIKDDGLTSNSVLENAFIRMDDQITMW